MAQAELQRLRQQAAEKEAARKAQAVAATIQAAAMAPQPLVANDQALRTLKISWDPQAPSLAPIYKPTPGFCRLGQTHHHNK